MKAKQLLKNQKVINNDFNAFIEEIKNGNVLLMVGHSFECNKDIFNGDFYDYLLRELNKIAGTDDLDFSDLSYDNRFLLDKVNHNHIRNLHEEIIKLIEANEYSATEDASSSLMRLIKTGLFKFVFTTSFDPLVEIAMQEQFGKIKVMNIYDKANRDIKSKLDFDIPTVYYLFGKAMAPKENEVAKKFVVTDNDALEVLRKWQLDMSNSNLLRYTSDKYILTLGCTQGDWLFRFIWYTLKGESNKLSRGAIAGHDGSKSLSHYLKMNRILIDNNNNADELVERIIHATTSNDIFRSPTLHCDVFISYSRSDSDVADKLYNSLTSIGLKVWYDKNNLGGNEGGRFMDLIKASIDTSILFIAILSQSISRESHDVHIYRKEWEWAKDLKQGLTADGRCYATYADNYDINRNKYNDSLGWLAETDNFEYSATTPDFDRWAQVLNNKILQIKSRQNEHHGE